MTTNMAETPKSSPRKKRGWSLPAAIIAYVVSVAVIVGLIIGNVFAFRYSDLVSIYFGQSTQQVVPVEGEKADYFTSDFTNETDRQAYLEKVSTDIAREGITLIQNDGGLPLEKSARITVLGQSSVDPVYGGGGAGSIDPAQAISLDHGLTAAGFSLNPTVTDFYTTGPGKDFRRTTPDVRGQGSFAVNEVPADLYTSDIVSSFADYSDAAVVVIARSGGESSDLAATPDAQGHTYLQLNDEERDLLTLATENFDDVVVLLNTQNPVELGVLANADVDATLWIGALGQTGATAVGEVLAGTVNPSGGLVDTYAYDSLSAPSIENFGDYSIVNSTVPQGNKYLVYAEGIYVGYRYYETRYEDVVLGNEPASAYDYEATVEYPFGHGLSYTDFSWSNYSVTENADAFTVSVEVTNTGEVAGKDIVQLYLQSPYTEYDRQNGIEKSAVELAGYAKTSLLDPGASETVTAEVPKELMKSYDSKSAGTYVLDAGDYYLAAGENAHAALNNILAAKGFSTSDGMDADGDAALAHKTTVDSLDSTTYAVSQATGTPITNQFADVDIRYYDDTFTYLSRSDWTGTWPTTFADGSWTAPAEMLSDLEITHVDDPEAVSPTFGTIDDKYGKLTTATLIGEDYDNELWPALLGQASYSDLEQLVRIGGYATRGVDAIQLPATVAKDGPAGFSATLVGGDGGMGYPPAIVLASSWNDELAKESGIAIGEDSLALKITGWYAPSMNIHRSPYSGRNFEYYSEDGMLSGSMAAAVIDGAQSKGVLVFAKHFALNDQETNRIGAAVFANEESIRELYLQPFESAVRDGKARGIMDSMNRIGATWSGGHRGLMTSTLREEWGFTGVAITDQASFAPVFAYEDLREGLAAGTDLWLNTDASLWEIPADEVTPTVEQNVVRAAHNIAFAVAHSNAMNGLSAGATIQQITPLWQWTLIIADVVIGLLIAALVFFATRGLIRRRRSTQAPTIA